MARLLVAGNSLEPHNTKCMFGNEYMAENRNSGMVIICEDWTIRMVITPPTPPPKSAFSWQVSRQRLNGSRSEVKMRKSHLIRFKIQSTHTRNRVKENMIPLRAGVAYSN